MDWNIWRMGSQWPARPHGFTWLMGAAEQIAAAVIGDEWVGNEFAFEVVHLALAPPYPKEGTLLPQHYSFVWFWLGASHPTPIDAPAPSAEQWQEARTRWRWCRDNAELICYRKQLACTLIHQAAERGDLVFHARNEATGEMVLIPRQRWNCDTNIALARISRGRINLVQPMALEPSDLKERQRWLGRMTSWLFVTRDNLAAFLKTAAASPSEHTVASRSRAEGEAKDWLLQQFEKDEHRSTRRPRFKAEALKAIQGLSGRAFDRAWSQSVAGKHAHRANAGAPKKLPH
jgi:hypothetical protein